MGPGFEPQRDHFGVRAVFLLNMAVVWDEGIDGSGRFVTDW